MTAQNKSVLIKAKHGGEMKELSMCAWSRLIDVTEYFIRNAKQRTDMTDQQIIDHAVSSTTSCSSLETMRNNFLFRGARA